MAMCFTVLGEFADIVLLLFFFLIDYKKILRNYYLLTFQNIFDFILPNESEIVSNGPSDMFY